MVPEEDDRRTTGTIEISKYMVLAHLAFSPTNMPKMKPPSLLSTIHVLLLSPALASVEAVVPFSVVGELVAPPPAVAVPAPPVAVCGLRLAALTIASILVVDAAALVAAVVSAGRTGTSLSATVMHR